MRDTSEIRERFAEEVRGPRPDLALLCLLVGAEGDPEFGEEGIDAAQIELDRLAGLVPHAPGGGPAGWARALGSVLGERHGFHGTPADYRRLESSLLHHVLRRRRGLPILLSVVWMEVARRAGAPVYGLALPGHFVVGFGDPGAPGEPVLADPFAGGGLMSVEDTRALVASATGSPSPPEVSAPAGVLETVQRILNNVRAWAAARPERTDVQLWAVELALLLPSHPARLRYERAVLLTQRGDFMRGASEMEEYAEVIAEVDPSGAETARRRALSSRAMLN